MFDNSKVRILVIVAFSAVIIMCGRADQQAELVVVTYGGAWGDAVRKAFVEPFERQHNVTVRQESWSGDLGRLKAMVETGKVTWDVVDVEAYMVPLGAGQNLYEEIDYGLVPKKELLKEAVHRYGVATCFWSTVLAYNTAQYARPHPSGWRDFWDTQRFPGPRALRNDPVANLEIALLADGVAPEDIYPIDVSRALKMLDRIKNSVSVWWEAGEQPGQLIGSGEVNMSTAWNGRVRAAAEAGKPIELDWAQGLLSSDWWVIPRGTRNRGTAQEFIAFASSLDAQSEFPRYIPYGPVNAEALKRISPDILRDLPTAPENLAEEMFIDHEWWNANRERVLEEWNAWLLR